MSAEQTERRQKRTDLTALSLHYWLGSVADRTRSLAFVLADMQGLLLAASIDGPEAEELAALSPLLMRDEAVGLELLEWDLLRVRVDPVHIDGVPLLLCTVGLDDAPDAAVSQATVGVRRILAN